MTHQKRKETATMLVKDVMIPQPRTVKADDPVRSAAAIICTTKLSGLPVVDDAGDLIGLISEKDVLNALLPSYKEFLCDPVSARDFQGMEMSYKEVLTKTVRDLMTPRPYTVSPDDPILFAASRMALLRFRRIPVVDGNKLVGMISLGDIHKAIFKRELGLETGS